MAEIERRDKTQMLNKVPEVVLTFWIIKIMATTVGETGADFLATHINPAVAYGSIGVAFLAALAAQVRARQYIPWLYWLTVVLVSIVGTLITDAVTDGFGVSLYVSTAVFSVLLAVTFAAWYRSERSLSIHTITTTKREAYYWAAILFTFALGTAAGDLMAEKLQLGYALSGVIFAAMIGAAAIAHFMFRVNAILTFWLAYILTRPLGASLGDLLSQQTDVGGLGLGTTVTSLLFLGVIMGLIGVLTVSGRQQRGAAAK